MSELYEEGRWNGPKMRELRPEVKRQGVRFICSDTIYLSKTLLTNDANRVDRGTRSATCPVVTVVRKRFSDCGYEYVHCIYSGGARITVMEYDDVWFYDLPKEVKALIFQLDRRALLPPRRYMLPYFSRFVNLIMFKQVERNRGKA